MNKFEIYKRLNANNDIDILEHFPKRYDDNALTDLDVPLVNNTKFVILATLTEFVSINGGNLIRLEVQPVNSSKPVKLMLFGQPFYKNILRRGTTYYFLGIYKEKRNNMMVTSILGEHSILMENRWRPYYNLPSNISQQNFYYLIREILTYRNDYIVDEVPKKYKNKYKLEDRFLAFKDVHEGTTKEEIGRGLRVFKYEECLKYCVYNLDIKRKRSLIKKSENKIVDKLKINNFVASLDFRLTDDQLRAIREIIADLDSKTVMNRLLEGDVGSGKTIVAFITCYANYLRGGQSCFMCPTVTLARQHYQNALKVFDKYGLKIRLFDNSLKTKEKRELLSEIASGEVDLIIGTHSVFSKDVTYKNLSLVIIDEQHKFGVKQREEIISKGERTDHLMMSATPIPQTLSNMINLDLDVSTLKTFPSKERKVKTVVCGSASPLLLKSIERAFEVNKQVFVVCPKISKTESSSKLSAEVIYDEYVSKFGEENVSLMTSKTKKEDQERIYSDFVSKKKLILVSTSLIEVGVDVRDACLMIVYEANYFGLASLHQLRGRIGRSGEGALAILVYDGDDSEATEKLDFLATHDNGEDIAMFDLSSRGAGTVGTTKQSGESSLQVANFVEDKVLLQYAKNDAIEILNNLDDIENKVFYDKVIRSQQ